MTLPQITSPLADAPVGALGIDHLIIIIIWVIIIIMIWMIIIFMIWMMIIVIDLMYCCQMPSQMQVAPNAEWKGAVQELQTGRWSSSLSLSILKGWKQQNSQSQYGSKFYLNVFRAPALCLVGCDEDVGGDEERPVLGGRNHIVSFIPHSVEPLARILILWFWLVKEIFQTRRCRLSRWLLSPSPATDMRNVEGTLKNKPWGKLIIRNMEH